MSKRLKARWEWHKLRLPRISSMALGCVCRGLPDLDLDIGHAGSKKRRVKHRTWRVVVVKNWTVSSWSVSAIPQA